jgi:hypothetical protein
MRPSSSRGGGGGGVSGGGSSREGVSGGGGRVAWASEPTRFVGRLKAGRKQEEGRGEGGVAGGGGEGGVAGGGGQLSPTRLLEEAMQRKLAASRL